MNQALLVVPGMYVFSAVSTIFMYSAVHRHYKKALEVYNFEKAGGVHRTRDIVIESFVRFVSIAFLPVIIGTSIVYFLVSKHLSTFLSLFSHALSLSICPLFLVNVTCIHAVGECQII